MVHVLGGYCVTFFMKHFGFSIVTDNVIVIQFDDDNDDDDYIDHKGIRNIYFSTIICEFM